MAKVKIQDAVYDSHDILEIEIDVMHDNYVWEGGLFKSGKQKLEVNAGKDLPILMKYVADSEHIEQLDNLKLQYSAKTSKFVKELESKYDKNSDLYSQEYYEFTNKNNPYRRFFEDNSVNPKPIRSIKVIENKGPAVNDLEAAHKKTASTQEQLAQVLNLLTQALTQNKDIIKSK